MRRWAINGKPLWWTFGWIAADHFDPEGVRAGDSCNDEWTAQRAKYMTPERV